MISTGLYIHIPYCFKKCIYCDFYSIGSKNADWKAYCNALINEFRCRVNEISGKISTVYIGGGTPSLIPAENLTYLIENLSIIAEDRWNPSEFTIEVNPDDVMPGYADFLIASGINRVSMGVQSFIDSELRAICRRHSAKQALDAYKMLDIIDNKSIDLIFGLPGQTLESWEKSVKTAIELFPKHISAYSLMFEEGTPIYIMRRQGRISEANEELSFAMFETLSRLLLNNGYEQYEISNFAIPGYASQHNSSYWNGVPYIGIGASAHSYDGIRTRRANPCSVENYVSHYLSEKKYQSYKFYSEEILSDTELYNEFIMTRLRTANGIHLPELNKKFPNNIISHLERMSKKYINDGSLIESSGRLHLSHKGIMISDFIISDLMI